LSCLILVPGIFNNFNIKIFFILSGGFMTLILIRAQSRAISILYSHKKVPFCRSSPSRNIHYIKPPISRESYS
jgi:hypothetical protein